MSRIVHWDEIEFAGCAGAVEGSSASLVTPPLEWGDATKQDKPEAGLGCPREIGVVRVRSKRDLDGVIRGQYQDMKAATEC